MHEARDYLRHRPAEERLLSLGDDNKKGFIVKLCAVACALVLTGSLLGGYFFLRGRNVQRLQAGQTAAQAGLESPAPPKAQVFHDEVLLKGSKAVVGGSVRNIADETLEELNVEIELKARKSQTSVTRTVRVEPSSLSPGEEGRFALQITSGDWSETRVARLFSAKDEAEITFKPEAGARRPTERPPAPKVIVVPRRKSKGEDFLNTPDTPIRIP